MLPIGILMIEHRTSERVLKLMREESRRIEAEGRVHTGLIDAAVEFFRVHADRCHHGKEEDILFKRLMEKPLAEEHRAMIQVLIAEHAVARELVERLAASAARCATGSGAAREVAERLETLVEFYPTHIEKEDKRFFIPSMNYFSTEERDELLREGWKYDSDLFHTLYKEKLRPFERPV